MSYNADKNLGHSTTINGAPASSDRNSLTVGADGPSFYMITIWLIH